MKNIIYKFIFIFLIISYVCQVNAQDIKLERDKRTTRIPGSEMNKAQFVPVEAALKIEKKQPVTNEEIKFSIQWVNRSEDSIILYSLPSNVYASISDFKTRYISILRSGRITNSIGPWKLEDDLPFDIEAAYLNGVKQNIDFARQQYMTLPPNSVYEINFKFTRLVKVDDIKASGFVRTPPSAPRYPVQKGVYTFKLSMGLLSSHLSKIKVKESLTIPDMIIEYGL